MGLGITSSDSLAARLFAPTGRCREFALLASCGRSAMEGELRVLVTNRSEKESAVAPGSLAQPHLISTISWSVQLEYQPSAGCPTDLHTAEQPSQESL